MIPGLFKGVDISAWWNAAPPETRAALEAEWTHLAEDDPRVAHGSRNADYARRAFLLEKARSLGCPV